MAAPGDLHAESCIGTAIGEWRSLVARVVRDGEDCRHHGGRIAMVGGVGHPLAAAAAEGPGVDNPDAHLGWEGRSPRFPVIRAGAMVLRVRDTRGCLCAGEGADLRGGGAEGQAGPGGGGHRPPGVAELPDRRPAGRCRAGGAGTGARGHQEQRPGLPEQALPPMLNTASWTRGSSTLWPRPQPSLRPTADAQIVTISNRRPVGDYLPASTTCASIGTARSPSCR